MVVMASSAGNRALVARPLRVRLTPLQAAGRLCEAAASAVMLLHSGEVATTATAQPRRSFVAAFPDDNSCALDPHQQHRAAPSGGLAGAPQWVGVVPYEARRGLERAGWSAPDRRPAPFITTPRWLRYPAVCCFDAATGRAQVVGCSVSAIERLRGALERPRRLCPLPARLRLLSPPDAAAHQRRVRRAIELIRAGDLYQVCVGHRIEVGLQGQAFALFRSMLRRAPARYAAYLELGDGYRVLSTSPELLLRAEVGQPACSHGSSSFRQLWSEPIKGTRPRAANAVADRQQARLLADDAKEAAELAMIVDVVRNDLGRVARVGSVRLVRPPHVVTHRTVHHRRALLAALADEQATRLQVLLALLPSGSVTGAPKVRAMEVIADLESQRRGLYTGAIGYVSHAGSLRLAMAIRTLVLHQRVGHYWTGGGIVADSDPQREWEETGWKATQLCI